MAFTAVRNYRFAEGNKYRENWTVTADANSGSFQTGLSVIDAIDGVAVFSAATGSQKFKANLNASATATNGAVFCSSCTAGDQFNIVCIGH